MASNTAATPSPVCAEIWYDSNRSFDAHTASASGESGSPASFLLPTSIVGTPADPDRVWLSMLLLEWLLCQGAPPPVSKHAPSVFFRSSSTHDATLSIDAGFLRTSTGLLVSQQNHCGSATKRQQRARLTAVS